MGTLLGRFCRKPAEKTTSLGDTCFETPLTVYRFVSASEAKTYSLRGVRSQLQQLATCPSLSVCGACLKEWASHNGRVFFCQVDHNTDTSTQLRKGQMGAIHKLSFDVGSHSPTLQAPHAGQTCERRHLDVYPEGLAWLANSGPVHEKSDTTCHKHTHSRPNNSRTLGTYAS